MEKPPLKLRLKAKWERFKQSLFYQFLTEFNYTPVVTIVVVILYCFHIWVWAPLAVLAVWMFYQDFVQDAQKIVRAGKK